MKDKTKTVRISQVVYNDLKENERLLRKEKYIRWYDFGWARRVLVKSNDEAFNALAEELDYWKKSAEKQRLENAHYIALINKFRLNWWIKTMINIFYGRDW